MNPATTANSPTTLMLSYIQVYHDLTISSLHDTKHQLPLRALEFLVE
jgi:hypothetical protein